MNRNEDKSERLGQVVLSSGLKYVCLINEGQSRKLYAQ